jgi:hypothetical protein
MKNKYSSIIYAILLFLLVTATTIITTDSHAVSGIDSPTNTDMPAENISDEQIREVLQTDKQVVVSAILPYGENCIAIGSKQNHPYFSIIENADKTHIIESVSSELKGSITDIQITGLYLRAMIDTGSGKISKDFFISGNQIIPYYKKQLTINYSNGITITPKYLVIHETDNYSVGADADAHYRYWSTNADAEASTHFVVDSTQIYQMLELNQKAWHVGDNKEYSDITNSNAIGIEIAVNDDGNFETATQHAINLTIAIMRELHMTIDQLKMHNDASGKEDPIHFLNNPKLWDDFIAQVQAGIVK